MVTECHPTCGWLRSRVLLITHSSSFTFLPFWHFSCSSFLLFTSVLLCWSIHFRHFKLKVVSEIPGFVFKEAAPILEHLLRSGRVLTSQSCHFLVVMTGQRNGLTSGTFFELFVTSFSWMPWCPYFKASLLNIFHYTDVHPQESYQPLSPDRTLRYFLSLPPAYLIIA